MNAITKSKLRCADVRNGILGTILLAALPAIALLAPHKAYSQDKERSGKEVVEAVCARCHATGEQGAPKIGDQAAWAKRASQGLTSLTVHALNGIRKMPAHGGSPGLSDLEIQRAITYMVNQSGGHWIAPVSEKELAAERGGKQVVEAQCAKCHEKGLNGAPKIGDRAAWTARMEKGLKVLVRSAIRGHGGMPPRGGQADLTDSELRSAILYMFDPARAASAEQAHAAAVAAPHSREEKTVGGVKIFVGFASAESLRAYPPGSVERRMHGGVPQGPGYYHLNVSLFDRASDAPLRDAKVEARFERPGFGGEWTTLQAMPSFGTGSYGAFVHAAPQTSYAVTLRIHTPDSPNPVEWRFEHTF